MATGALRGRHVLELGAGPGLPSLFAAKTGARCTVTDLEKVLPLIEQNIAANGLRGAAEAAPLQWGAPGDRAAAAALATPAPDFLLACDTCYLDPVRSVSLFVVLRLPPFGAPLCCQLLGTCKSEAAAAQGDEGGLGLPSVQDFVGVCRACMGCNTTFLLAFEPRASAVREELLVCLRRTFATCREVPSSAWREALPCEHVEMFEMRL